MSEIPFRLFFSPQSWFSFQDIYTENKELFSHLNSKTIEQLKVKKVGWGYPIKKNKKMLPHSTKNRLILLEKNEHFLITKNVIHTEEEIKADCYFHIKKWGKKGTLLVGRIDIQNQEPLPINQIILFPCDHRHVFFHVFNELFSIL